MFTKNKNDQKKLIPGFIRLIIYILIGPTLLFISAGTIQWTMAWVYATTSIVLMVGSRILLFNKYPDLAKERAGHREVKGVKSWDRVLSAVVGFFGNLAILCVAGLDKRFGWSPGISPAASLLAFFFGILLANIFGSWALLENQYFSAVVRIQEDRSHEVCTSGPYQFIRHPGYAGALLFYLSTPIVLSALWAFVPAGLTVIALIIRTHLEDITLQEELEGYTSYVEKTPYRLIPEIW